jgi:hypothetical protein
MDNQTETVQEETVAVGVGGGKDVNLINPSDKSTGRYRFIDELKNWDQNPKKVEDSAYERTLNQVDRLGQYKPVLAMLDGTVIGGNTRLKVYKDLGVEYVWVSDLEFQKEEDGFHAYVNGERQEESFDTELDGMVEYALSDNDESGVYEKDKLMVLVNQTSIDLEKYAANIDPISTIDKLLVSKGIGGDTYMKYELVIQADNEESLKKLYETTISQGFKAKAVAKLSTRRKK